MLAATSLTGSATRTTGKDQQLRGERLHGRRHRLRRTLANRWKGSPEADWLFAGVIVGAGLIAAAAFDLWALVDVDSRQLLGLQALVILGTLTGFMLTALGIARAIRGYRSVKMAQPGVRSVIDQTWIRTIGGAFGGLLLIGVSWAVDVAFGWSWTGWLALGASVFVISRLARGLWLFLSLLGLAD